MYIYTHENDAFHDGEDVSEGVSDGVSECEDVSEGVSDGVNEGVSEGDDKRGDERARSASAVEAPRRDSIVARRTKILWDGARSRGRSRPVASAPQRDLLVAGPANYRDAKPRPLP